MALFKGRSFLSVPFRALRFFAVGSLVASAWTFSSHVVDAVRLLGMGGGAAAALTLAMNSSPPEEIRQRAEQALLEEDPELAESLALAAEENDFAFPPELLARIESAKVFSWKREATQVWTGATTGKADTPTAFAAAMTVDMTAIGDVRDLISEISKIPRQDNVMMLLAASGVAMAANTLVTQGVLLPAKGGLSMIKAGKKLGRLSRSLEDDFVKIANESIDSRALASMTRHARELDLKKVSSEGASILRPAAIEAVGDASRAVYSVSKSQGYRATMQTLEHANEVADLKKLSAGADKLGPRYRAGLALRKGAALTLDLMGILANIIWILVGVFVWIGSALWVVFSSTPRRHRAFHVSHDPVP